MKGKPEPPKVAAETWRMLLAQAVEFQQLAPWQWMTNYAVLGLHEPDTGKIRFADVLGNAGEVFGLVIYRGPLGVRMLLETLWTPEDPRRRDLLFNLDAIKLEFVEKQELRPEDRALYQQLKFKPPPKQPHPWPSFQSFSPGFLPWFLDQDEAEALLADLRKVIRFARLVRDCPGLYEGHTPREVPFVPVDPHYLGPERKEDLAWHLLQLPPEPPPKPFAANDSKLAHLSVKSRQPNFACELGSFYLNTSVWDAGRPYYTKVALLVDAATGYVYGFHLSGAAESLEETAGHCLLKNLSKLKHLPEQIVFPNERLRQAMQPLAAKLGIDVEVAPDLPMLEEARTSMEQFFLSGA